MEPLLPVLFDQYTRKEVRLPDHGQLPQNAHQFSRLKELVGEELAVELWDAAAEYGAQEEEYCFKMGVKVGIQLAAEFLTQEP